MPLLRDSMRYSLQMGGACPYYCPDSGYEHKYVSGAMPVYLDHLYPN